MPRQPEGKLKKAVKQYLESRGAVVWSIHGGSPFQEAGIPDLLACWRGLFIGLEVKLPGQKPTKLQNRAIKKINSAGGIASVVTSVQDVVDLLTKYE